VGTLWFCLIGVMLVIYVLLDGFDLGVGAIHFLVGKTPEERRQVLGTIGPVWDGNEVWLLAAGGTMFFAFPALYASGFSGFYLPLMTVLWLLILRGISVEFRNHLRGDVWRPLWDFLFSAASLLLAVFYGAALGNVVRGVPLDASGYFFEPLWTNWRVGAETGILDWYTVLAGVCALVALGLHGALWVQLKTAGAVNERSRRLATRAWWIVVGLTLIVTVVTFRVQPQLRLNFADRPWGVLFPALAIGGLAAIRWHQARRNELRAFLASCVYLAGMLASVIFGVYPMVLPARSSEFSLTVDSAEAGAHGLKVGLVWWIIGMILAALYYRYVYKSFAGKVAAEPEPPAQ